MEQQGLHGAIQMLGRVCLPLRCRLLCVQWAVRYVFCLAAATAAAARPVLRF